MYILLIIILFMFGAIANHLFWSYKRLNNRHIDMFSVWTLTIIALLAGVIVFISIPGSRAQDRIFANQMVALQTTLDNARLNDEVGSSLERVQILNKVAAYNIRLEEYKYWANSPWVSIWYDKAAINGVKPVK